MSLTKATYSMIEGASANVLDFGADPTGVADSSAAFAAAVATGKSVFVPSGVYKASFDLGNNQTIFGEGAKNKSVIKPPAGATHCIRIDASSVPKQHCQIKDIGLQNIDAVANCVGLLFNGTDVNSINDWHIISNLYIVDFNESIKVLGRQIWSSYYNVEIEQGGAGLVVNTDPTTPAFNGNTFFNCRFSGCEREGVRIEGQNTNIAFYSSNFELCNTLDVAGVAAVYVEDSEQLSFISCYWEDNGGGVPVDTVTLSNNSIGVKLAGSVSYTAKFEQCFMTGSGVLVWVAASVRGGILENSRLDPLTNGYSLYISSALAGIAEPAFAYDSSNFDSGKIEIVQDGNGNYAGRVSQSTSCYWLTSTQAVDLTQMSKLVVNPNGTTFTGITTIYNRIPGMELWVWNDNGANTFTIDASLIYRGSGVIGPLSGKRYIVGGFPANGRLIEM